MNSPRRPGPNGEGDEEARDGQTPLHLASNWGLEDVGQCLLEFGANVNAQVGPINGPACWTSLPWKERSLSVCDYKHMLLIMYVSFCQDAEGRTPIHAAISNQHNVIIQLLISHPDIRLNIRDRQGMTPFACAMTHKNNKAAEAILKREPGAAEQVGLS